MQQQKSVQATAIMISKIQIKSILKDIFFINKLFLALTLTMYLGIALNNTTLYECKVKKRKQLTDVTSQIRYLAI